MKEVDKSVSGIYCQCTLKILATPCENSFLGVGGVENGGRLCGEVNRLSKSSSGGGGGSGL